MINQVLCPFIACVTMEVSYECFLVDAGVRFLE